MAGESVLIVEDTDLFRRIYQDKLTQDGFVVRGASDGIEAINILRTERIDLVLLDLIMPRMSGLEALDAIKADPHTREIPVIVLSNLGESGDIERGMSMGAADYLIKSAAKPADVSAKIRETLAKAAAAHVDPAVYRLHLRDREADADRLIADAELQRRLWCPDCEEELTLELTQDLDRPGWYDAHLICSSCGRAIGHDDPEGAPASA